MSAEDLGTRLLADVHEERLDELLSSLRVLHDPLSSCRLGIPQLDHLVALFAGVQPRPAHQTRQIAPPVDTWERPDTDDTIRRQPLVPVKQKAPPIVEITAPGPNNGKSQLLYYMTALAILPKTIDGVPLKGQDAVVVVLDTESRFSVPRLVQVMRHYIHTCISGTRDAAETTNPHLTNTTQPPSASEIESTVAEALTHVHIYRPQSLASLTATVTAIPNHLLPSNSNTTITHQSGKKHVAQILLDSASSFFWQDKADTETASLPPDSTTTTAATTTTTTTPVSRKPQSGYVALASAIKETGARLKCPFVYTTWDLSSTSSSTGQQGDANAEPSIRPHLPQPWQAMPTLRLVVSRKAVRRFPVGTTAREAVAQREAREKAVGAGVFELRVNRWGEGEWTQRVVEGLRRLGGGGFEVVVGGLGVVVDGMSEGET